jgi:hypothetical protein
MSPPNVATQVVVLPAVDTKRESEDKGKKMTFAMIKQQLRKE